MFEILILLNATSYYYFKIFFYTRDDCKLGQFKSAFDDVICLD